MMAYGHEGFATLASSSMVGTAQMPSQSGHFLFGWPGYARENGG